VRVIGPDQCQVNPCDRDTRRQAWHKIAHKTFYTAPYKIWNKAVKNLKDLIKYMLPEILCPQSHFFHQIRRTGHENYPHKTRQIPEIFPTSLWATVHQVQGSDYLNSTSRNNGQKQKIRTRAGMPWKKVHGFCTIKPSDNFSTACLGVCSILSEVEELILKPGDRPVYSFFAFFQFFLDQKTSK
jgi:hypothetical protein